MNADADAPPLPNVIGRLLAMRKPEGGVEAILAYLPSAEDDVLAGDLRTALSAMAMKDGKADPALLKALEDKLAMRRAAAAEALAFAGGAEQREAVRKLLKDDDPSVRVRAAIALTSAQDKESMPGLIALLTEVPPAMAGQVEEHLRLLVNEAHRPAWKATMPPLARSRAMPGRSGGRRTATNCS